MTYAEYKAELRQIKKSLGTHFVQKALDKSDWCVAAAARFAELDRRNFCRLMKQLGITRPPKC